MRVRCMSCGGHINDDDIICERCGKPQDKNIKLMMIEDD